MRYRSLWRVAYMPELTSSHRKILELFSQLGVEELDAETVARKIGWKKSTAKKYMDQLAKMGYLVKKAGSVYALAVKEEVEEKPEAEKPEEQAKPEPAPEQPTPQVEEMGKEALELKPSGEIVETFYFYLKGSTVPLRVSSLEQLAAVLKFKLIEPEELAYAVRTGFLQTWIERSLHDEDLARKLDELRGLNDQELFNEVAKMVLERANPCRH
jgi:DNA-binding MarR family transcriptional regulator